MHMLALSSYLGRKYRFISIYVHAYAHMGGKIAGHGLLPVFSNCYYHFCQGLKYFLTGNVAHVACSLIPSTTEHTNIPVGHKAPIIYRKN